MNEKKKHPKAGFSRGRMEGSQCLWPPPHRRRERSPDHAVARASAVLPSLLHPGGRRLPSPRRQRRSAGVGSARARRRRRDISRSEGVTAARARGRGRPHLVGSRRPAITACRLIGTWRTGARPVLVITPRGVCHISRRTVGLLGTRPLLIPTNVTSNRC